MRDKWSNDTEQDRNYFGRTTIQPILISTCWYSQNLVENTANSNSPWEMINGRKYDEYYLRHELGQFGIFYENRNPSSKEAPKGDVGM